MKKLKVIISSVLLMPLMVPLSQAQTLYKEDFKDKPSSAWQRDGMRWIESTGKMRIDYNIYKSGGRVGSFPKIVASENFDRATEATLKYRINLDENYTTSVGGKFFGVGPKNPITGCKDIVNNGWSARVGIRNKTPQLYIYDQSKPNGLCGERIVANQPLVNGRWYDIALYVKLNSRGNINDAQAILYVDGREVARKTGFKFYDGTSRTAPTEAKIQKMLIHNFLGSINSTHGGIQDSGTIRYDDFEVLRGKHP